MKKDKDSTCEGEQRDSEPHGFGKRVYPDGSVYEGEWEAGHKSAQSGDFTRCFRQNGQ